MDKLGDEQKFTYDNTLDPDVVSTLASGKLAEDEYNRHRGWYGWNHHTD